MNNSHTLRWIHKKTTYRLCGLMERKQRAILLDRDGSYWHYYRTVYNNSVEWGVDWEEPRLNGSISILRKSPQQKS